MSEANGATPVRVLVVDDQPVVRAGFRFLLDAEPDLEVVGEAGDGAEAIRLATELRPDVVVMDLRMPVLDGIAATRQIVAGAPPVPEVLVVTTFDVDEYVFAALRAGASGFLLKDSHPAVLADAVRTVSRGEALVAPRATRQLIEAFVRASPQHATGIDPTVVDRLTEREKDVLRLLARGMSNVAVGGALGLTEGTVKTHVSNLLAKLHLRSRMQAVVLAYECGLVRPGALAYDELLSDG